MNGDDLDLVVWGATGYTGRLVAQAVADRAPPSLRWAVAGRDPERLAEVRENLGAGVEAITADAHDRLSLDAMVRRTKAIVSTVGPYSEHGTPLVAACVAARTHYADVTGEPLWMRRTIEDFHDPSQEDGTAIVHACGFDSVPSDLGMWRLQTASLERHGQPCRSVLHIFGPLAGGVSGGTVATALDTIASVSRAPEERRALADRDLLAPDAASTPAVLDPWWPERAIDEHGWTAPFAMAMVNAKVVRRSRALLGEPWGTDVRYRERLRTKTWARAAAIGLATRAGPVLLAIGPIRELARRIAASPGEGPTDETRASGFFRTTLVGHVGAGVEPVVVTIEARLDPAYGATARMLAVLGLGLASGEFTGRGGVLTPAVAGGMRLVERLGEAGIHIRVAPAGGA